MDVLWPDLAPEAAAANLRKAVHFARQALAPSTWPATRCCAWRRPATRTGPRPPWSGWPPPTG
jgi:DNA-binding SARP family transcriptional activator